MISSFALSPLQRVLPGGRNTIALYARLRFVDRSQYSAPAWRLSPLKRVLPGGRDTIALSARLRFVDRGQYSAPAMRLRSFPGLRERRPPLAWRFCTGAAGPRSRLEAIRRPRA